MGLFDQSQGLMGLGQQPLNLSGGRNFMPNALGSAYEPTRQPQGNMPPQSYGVPSPFMNQGAMFRREQFDPSYVPPNYTTQDVQTAMRSPEFDSNYYRNASVLDAQGNPMSAQARQQLIQPFYNQQQQPNFAMPTGMNSQGFPIYFTIDHDLPFADLLLNFDGTQAIYTHIIS